MEADQQAIKHNEEIKYLTSPFFHPLHGWNKDKIKAARSGKSHAGMLAPPPDLDPEQSMFTRTSFGKRASKAFYHFISGNKNNNDTLFISKKDDTPKIASHPLQQQNKKC